MSFLKLSTCLLIMVLPWRIRRRLLIYVLDYSIAPTAKIGLAWVFPEMLIMGENSRIGHLTICKGMSLLQLGDYSSIGRGNWITGFPEGNKKHFVHQKDRRSVLIVGAHSAITNRHLIDCTNTVSIGKFTTLAGFRSQILTHSIDIEHCRQSSKQVAIGDYCFIGTDSVLLGGAVLPSYSVLGAKSLLNKVCTEEYTLYGGVPARSLKNIPHSHKYFSRPVGFVN